jgi:hypothetical protein
MSDETALKFTEVQREASKPFATVGGKGGHSSFLLRSERGLE